AEPSRRDPAGELQKKESTESCFSIWAQSGFGVRSRSARSRGERDRSFPRRRRRPVIRVADRHLEAAAASMPVQHFLSEFPANGALDRLLGPAILLGGERGTTPSCDR